MSTPTTIIPPDGTDPGPPLTTCSDDSSPSCGNPSDQLGDQNEATLDVQRVGSVAPGAPIDLIVSADTNSMDGVNIAIDYAVDHDPVPAKILSISFTSCEADNSRAIAESLDDFFAQAAARRHLGVRRVGRRRRRRLREPRCRADSRASRAARTSCAPRSTSPASAAPNSPTPKIRRRTGTRRKRRIFSRRSATSRKVRGTSR